MGTIHIASHAPVVDGRLDDDVWAEATRFTDFVQREPREGEPVSERTEVRLLTDGEALYVAAWLCDREPHGIVPGEKIRDVTLTNSDYFAIILDTYLDRQNGFVFATTPAGVEYDGQVVKEGEGGGVIQSGQTRAQAGSMGGFNLNWDGSWRVVTSTDSTGWYAEFRIPFSTLRYGGGRHADLGPQPRALASGARTRRRSGRSSRGSSTSTACRARERWRASASPSRRVATVTPYVLGRTQRNYLDGLADVHRRERWAPTPSTG